MFRSFKNICPKCGEILKTKILPYDRGLHIAESGSVLRCPKCGHVWNEHASLQKIFASRPLGSQAYGIFGILALLGLIFVLLIFFLKPGR